MKDKKIFEVIKKCDFSGFEKNKMDETKEKSKEIYYSMQSEECTSFIEFLVQQAQFIEKRWWCFQFLILFLMWYMVGQFGQEPAMRRIIGVGASIFAMFIVPELWKNRENDSVEVEDTCIYSMRQIIRARLLLFGFIDLNFLSVFGIGCVTSGKILAQDIIIQFLLPYLVTCCICFTCFYGRVEKMFLAVILSIIWCVLWAEIILSDRVYEIVSVPIWFGMVAATIVYLILCITRGQQTLSEFREVRV